MKVAHVITRLILGGAQENTVYTCIDLARLYGVDVRLYTGPTTGPEGSLVERTRQAGIPLIEIPDMVRAIRPWSDWRAYGQLKQALREFKPDIVHTHSAKAGILGRAAGRALRVPVVVHTIHGAPWYPDGNWISRTFNQVCERWAANRCDHLIGVADAMRELFLDAGIGPKEKFTTIYSGMEVEPFLQSQTLRDATRRRFGLTDDDIVFGKIARLFRLKGHDELIAAAERVVKQTPNARFLLVGDGILRSQLEAAVRSKGLQDRFIFAGLVPPDEIPALIAAMDIVVHTSLREGLARVLPQGLLSGKPVISYDIDGAREVVLDNRTGFLLPPRDTRQLAARIIQLAHSPELRRQFGEEGRRLFARQFDHHYMTERIRGLYESLLQRRPFDA